MPLKEVKEPKKEGKKKQPSEPANEPGTANAGTTTDPWKYLDDGSKVRQGRKLPFENNLRELFDAVAGGVSLADSFSGAVIGNQAEELAYGYAKLAKEDPRIKAFFEKLVTGSAYSAVVIPTALTAVPILWHFGLLPGHIGVPATMAVGLTPFTREEERAAVVAQHQQQQQPAEAAEGTVPPTHPRGEATGDGDEQP